MKPTREFPDSAPYENTEAVLAVEQRVKQALKSGAAVAIDDSRQLVEALRRARVTIENYRARENELLQRLEREPRFEVPEAAASRGLGATDAITEWAGDEKPGYAPEHLLGTVDAVDQSKAELKDELRAKLKDELRAKADNMIAEHKHSSLPPESEQKPEDGPSQEGEYFRAVRQRTRLSMALVPVQPEEESVQLEPLPVVDDREPPERDLPAEEP